MDYEIVVLVFGFVAVYVAGILTHKYVIDQAEKLKAHISNTELSIKEHASDAEKRLRGEITALKSQFEYLKKI